jgi:hypothetical protein
VDDFSRRRDRIGQSNAASKPHAALPKISIRTHHSQDHERVQRTPTVLLQRSATPTDTHEMRRGEVPSHSPIRTSRRIHALFGATHANQNSASATALGRMVNYTVRHILCNLQSLRFMAHAACRREPLSVHSGDSVLRKRPPGRVWREMPGDANLCRLRVTWSLPDPVPDHHHLDWVGKVCKSASFSMIIGCGSCSNAHLRVCNSVTTKLCRFSGDHPRTL